VLENRGIRQGISQGRLQEKHEIAQNMLNAGEDYSKITRFTGLDIERITTLDTELQAQA